MAIKSLEELKQIREKYSHKVALRDNGTSNDGKVEVMVGMATCGIAAGADKTYDAFEKAIKEQNLDIELVKVGCIGYCHKEPTVQINVPGNEPVIYGGVLESSVSELIENHIQNNEVVDGKLLDTSYHSVKLDGGA